MKRTKATGTLPIIARPSQNNTVATSESKRLELSGRTAGVSRLVWVCTSRLTPAVRPYASLKATDDERDILSAEAEAVTEGVVNAFFACAAGDVVEITFRIGRFVIEGRRQHAATDGLHAGD